MTSGAKRSRPGGPAWGTIRQLVAGPAAEPVLLWRYEQPRRVISSGSVGGGIGIRHWALNIEVPSGYDRTDIESHVGDVASHLGLVGEGVGLLTAARVADHAQVIIDDVAVCATVGLSRPVWAAATEDVRRAEDAGLVPGPGLPGTINVVVDLPFVLPDAALVNLVITATEAKSQALVEAGVDGSGTASDAVLVSCPDDQAAAARSDRLGHDRFGGPRSVWGARVANAVHEAIRSRIAR